MEVKIKNNEEMIDATIEVIDGVMVVSPVKKFEPKEGDVVAVNDGQHVFINKEYLGERHGYAYIGWNFDNNMKFNEGVWDYSRFATESEKEKLFTKLAEEGYEWDVKGRKLIKVKWQPLLGEIIWLATGSLNREEIFSPSATMYSKNMEEAYELGRAFKTEAECQAFCDKLNKAINQVKP